MDVWEAVAGRRSTRAFLDQPVERPLLERALAAAGRAPSGGNLQPWQVAIVTGQAKDDLVASVRQRMASGGAMPQAEYPVYPPSLWSPYRERRFTNGEQLYAALGIPREDKAARLMQFARNWEFFGAPVGGFLLVDRGMGAPQWADLGAFLQTFLLLLEAEGVSACPQEAWSAHHDLVAEAIGMSSDLMVFCGIAIGYADPSAPVNQWTSDRAPLEEWVTFH